MIFSSPILTRHQNQVCKRSSGLIPITLVLDSELMSPIACSPI
nr:MAG TPA: hypothetical protein [Caudoviricetes sp.]